jgi:hypothetical protein
VPTVSDFAMFILGFTWASIGFPYIFWTWRATDKIYYPLHPPIWARCGLWVGFMFIFVMLFGEFSSNISKDFGENHYGKLPLGMGNLVGLVFYALSLRYTISSRSKK